MSARPLNTSRGSKNTVFLLGFFTNAPAQGALGGFPGDNLLHVLCKKMLSFPPPVLELDEQVLKLEPKMPKTLGTILTCEAWNASCWHVNVSYRAPGNGILKFGCSLVCTFPMATFHQHWSEEHCNYISTLCLGEIHLLLFDKVLGRCKTARNKPPFSYGFWRDHLLHLRACWGQVPAWPQSGLQSLQFNCPGGCGREMLQQTDRIITEQSSSARHSCHVPCPSPKQQWKVELKKKYVFCCTSWICPDRLFWCLWRFLKALLEEREVFPAEFRSRLWIESRFKVLRSRLGLGGIWICPWQLSLQFGEFRARNWHRFSKLFLQGLVVSIIHRFIISYDVSTGQRQVWTKTFETLSKFSYIFQDFDLSGLWGECGW